MKLRVIETFAGIGAQRKALSNIKANYEVVGTSEWYIDAIIAYDAIHHKPAKNNKRVSREKMIEELDKFTFSTDSKTPLETVAKLKQEKLEKLYWAHKRNKNLGSIVEIHGKDMPEHDLLTYSFPCQDLSLAGRGGGLKENSGTRSSLLWEVKRLLTELKESKKLPNYLLMENVPNVVGPSNIQEFKKFKKQLEELGYKNFELELEAADFGLPQLRKRFFMVSALNEKSFDDNRTHKKEKQKFTLNDIVDPANMKVTAHEEKYLKGINLKNSPLEKRHINLGVYSFNQANVVLGSNIEFVNTITHAGENSYQRVLMKHNGKYTVRYLNSKQNLRLMGFDETDHKNIAASGIAERKITSLAGNSIAVPVLEWIFKGFKNE